MPDLASRRRIRREPQPSGRLSEPIKPPEQPTTRRMEAWGSWIEIKGGYAQPQLQGPPATTRAGPVPPAIASRTTGRDAAGRQASAAERGRRAAASWPWRPWRALTVERGGCGLLFEEVVETRCCGQGEETFQGLLASQYDSGIHQGCSRCVAVALEAAPCPQSKARARSRLFLAQALGEASIADRRPKLSEDFGNSFNHRPTMAV